MLATLQQNWQNGFIETNGIQLHYVTQGQGALILMLHGFPEFWYSWRHQIPEFAKDYKVVALDLRGYNDSEKPPYLKAYRMEEFLKDIEGVIKGLGYDRCILIGHDWGGAIAWFFADAYPQMVEKLIILNLPHPAKFMQGLRTPQQLLKSSYMFFFQLPWLPERVLKANHYQPIARMIKKMAVDKNAFTSDDLQAYQEAAAKPGALTAMLNYYRNIFPDFLQNTLKNWKMIEPLTLIIWGENDTALGKELTDGTEKYVKNLRIKYISNCSHWVQQECPQLVNQYIHEFL